MEKGETVKKRRGGSWLRQGEVLKWTKISFQSESGRLSKRQR